MIAEIYDALLDAGAAEPKARRAAEALAGHEDRFNRLEMAIAGSEARLDSKIGRLEARLDGKIDRVEAKLEAKIDHVETVLRGEQVVVRWMLGTIVAFSAAIILKLFLH